MKTVFFESLLYKLITKNDFYFGSCPDIHITTVDCGIYPCGIVMFTCLDNPTASQSVFALALS